MSIFADRVAVLATMHRKEQVIAPILQDALNIRVEVPAGFNSDLFGTFTRDIDRLEDARSTARQKAEKALLLTGETLAIASEGSFGPHPAVPFLACDRELVVLIDSAHDLEIVGQAFSTQTNYRHQRITSQQEAQAFAAAVGFPTHGLVVMAPNTRLEAEIIKGITSEAGLAEAVERFLNQFGEAHVETDMRAMHNPTRMQVIAEATRDLVRKMQQTCPQCDRPGFDVTERQRGLPCAWCGSPTDLVLMDVYRCDRCGYMETVRFPDQRETADPAQCGFCNP